MTLSHQRLCAELTDQTRLLAALLPTADLGAKVPSCPEWSLADLVVHVGGAHRWAAEIVRTRASTEVEEADVPDFTPPLADDAGVLGEWLPAGAALLAGTLREAGAQAPVWSWFTDRRAGFWARRMVHETVVHRADACLAAGVEFRVAPEVGADTLDEWLELVSSPAQQDDPEIRQLRTQAGRRLRLTATDAPPALRADWLIELTADAVRWHRTDPGDATAPADVTLRGPLAEVLRVFYRRLDPRSERVAVTGDPALLDFWLARVSFS